MLLKRLVLKLYNIGFYKQLLLISIPLYLNYFLLVASLYYLTNDQIYIIEQKEYSHYNNSVYYIVPYFILLVLVQFIFYYKYHSKSKNNIRFYPERSIYNSLYIVVVFLLGISFLNVIISGTPPLLSGGYISRFDYLETTKLWFILQTFGQIVVIVPIILGFLFLYNTINQKSNIFVYLIFFSYLLYVVLIGQKFGGLTSGLTMLFTPYLLHQLSIGNNILKFKYIIYGFILLSAILSFVAYHYSQYTLAEEMGGPVQFILYRVFALQGHTTWGMVNHLENINFSTSDLYEGMKHMMLVVGHEKTFQAVERGVNFTGGYPIILDAVFPFMFNYVVHIIFILLFLFLSLRIIKNLYNLKLIPYIYLFIYFKSFLGLGSLSILINSKTIILLFLLFILEIVFYKRRKIHYDEKNINNNPNL